MNNTGLKGTMPKSPKGVDTTMKVERQGEVPYSPPLNTRVGAAPKTVMARGRGAMERILPTKIA
tara:strand:+ start:4007 stop:4198 length:192 start_codon:yes stop_codon:yes gene_type:complete